MFRWRLLAAAALAVAGLCSAQSDVELGNLQIHGFATQALVATSHNNYLSMDSRNGSLAWTEAALNVNDQVNDRLRAGVQFHYTRLGVFGGDDISVDWALGDYALNQYFGLRAGKVKIRWGLYNDTQDYDPGYMWSLLPETMYAVDWRATDLAQMGAEAYGKVPLGEHLGTMSYSAYYGNYFYSSSDGLMESFKEEGLNFTTPPGGKTPGFDLRWAMPVSGLEVGGSLMMYNATGTLTNGTFNQPTAFWPAYYAQYDFKKFFTSGQYSKVVEYNISNIAGSGPSIDGLDQRAWFAMGGYHLTDKLEAGAYYTHLLDAGHDNSDPDNYFRDWVVSGRYDFNVNFYLKMEGHFIDGNAVGFYTFDNPSGFARRTNAGVVKLGFSF